jgi:hypothetical protein
MVSVNYMIAKPPPPSGLRSLVNRRVIPAAIEAAARAEDAVYELGQGTKRQPVLALSLAAGAGALLALAWRRRA